MRDIVTENQVRRLMGERDLLLSAIAPADYAKIEARIVAISESPDEAVPAVPAQEAPQDVPNYVTCSTCGVKSLYDSWSKNRWFCPWCNKQPAEPQAGAQVPSQDEIPERHKFDYWTLCQTRKAALTIELAEQRHSATWGLAKQLIEELGQAETHLNSIKSYATEAAKTPITRESIFASQKAEGLTQDDIPSDLKGQYAFATEDDADDRVPSFTDTFVACLIERIARGQMDLRAQTQTALSQFDAMQGLCRLILSESGK